MFRQGVPTISRRGITTISIPVSGLRLRNSSRTIRLARLRVTAFPIFWLAAIPSRGDLRPFGRTNHVMNRPRNRVPCSYTCLNCDRRLSFSSLNGAGPHPPRTERPLTLHAPWISRRARADALRDRQALAALRPPSFEDDPSVLRRHPHEKPVRAAPPAPIRLKSSFH
jgi:hypothetical protein